MHGQGHLLWGRSTWAEPSFLLFPPSTYSVTPRTRHSPSIGSRLVIKTLLTHHLLCALLLFTHWSRVSLSLLYAPTIAYIQLVSTFHCYCASPPLGLSSSGSCILLPFSSSARHRKNSLMVHGASDGGSGLTHVLAHPQHIGPWSSSLSLSWGSPLEM